MRAAAQPGTRANPEEQLKTPTHNLVKQVGRLLGKTVIATGEGTASVEGRVDVAVQIGGLLRGHIELKRNGKGADPTRFADKHDKDQWDRFKKLPNIIYSDGQQWALYRTGVRDDQLLSFSGNLASDGAKAVSEDDARRLVGLLGRFFDWDVVAPTTSKGIADLLASNCSSLRDEIAYVLGRRDSELAKVARDWRERLFPDADDRTVADAYAQTFTYALLIARFEGAHPTSQDPDNPGRQIPNFTDVINKLHGEHSLLGEVLQLFSAPGPYREVETQAETILHVIGRINPAAIVTTRSQSNPWMYFYEEFLNAYDQRLRKEVGAYYTPPQVVTAQVKLVRDLLVNKFDKPLAFADDTVKVLDPAVGTGTYPLGVFTDVVDHTPDYLPPQAHLRQAMANTFGFEYLIGPYAVAHLRLTRFLADAGIEVSEKDARLNILLADTLASPEWANQVPLGSAYEAMNDERERAKDVKASTPVMVCLGNPPYRRGRAETGTGDAAGGWVVRRREPTPGQMVRNPQTRRMVADTGDPGIFQDFTEPAIEAGQGRHLRSLHNKYVYFWRWALWKVFNDHQFSDGTTGQNNTDPSPGIVSFITGSSFLRGPGFVGMRQHMRQVLDELWIIDLGGDNKGARKTPNVFAIETPVCIAVAVRYGEPNPQQPAKVHYTSLADMPSKEKLSVLETVSGFDSEVFAWQDCPDGWQDPFLPVTMSAYWTYPLLTDLFPWQENGVKVNRTWPIGEDGEVLLRRWSQLLSRPGSVSGDKAQDQVARNEKRADLLKETRDRKAAKLYPPLPIPGADDTRLSLQDEPDSAKPLIVRYGYRSLDRQWLIADNRVGDFMRPALWRAHSDRQCYVASSLTKELGRGQAVMASSDVPDLDFFNNRGAKDIIPLWKDREATIPNMTSGLLKVLGFAVTPEELFCYTYGLLGTRAYVDQFWDELTVPGPRLPITKNHGLFHQVAKFGNQLLFWHTYGERDLLGEGLTLEPGRAKHPTEIPSSPLPESYRYEPAVETIHVGDGTYTHVSPEVWNYSISGFQPVQSWLGYRMRKRAGRAGRADGDSLNAIRPTCWPDPTGEEFLTLLWIVEKTIGAEA